MVVSDFPNCDFKVWRCSLSLNLPKALLTKPVLPFVLRILAGLCKGHQDCQKLIGDSCVPELHRLEQVSAEGNIGSLAEEALEALRDNKPVFKRVTEGQGRKRATIKH